MKIDPGPVHQYLTQFEFSNWVRIFPFRHKSTPLQAVPTPSRFVPGTTFAGLYGATDLATGIAEAIVRDDFEMAPGSMRFITNGKLEKYCASEFRTKSAINLLDIRKPNDFRMGINTDAAGAKAHKEGQAFSESIYEHFPDVEGILYASRLTSSDCVVVYDRVIERRLQADEGINLMSLTSLDVSLEELNIRRGVA